MTEGVYHKWSPIKPIPKDMLECRPTYKDSKHDMWLEAKKDPNFLLHLQRLWSIETGMVENLYSISEGVCFPPLVSY